MKLRSVAVVPGTGLLAAGKVDAGLVYYIGLAVVIVILVGTIIAFYRTWVEIHEDEEPDSPADLLESFQQAHAEGQIDAQELERVRRLLSVGAGNEKGAAPRTHQPGAVVASDGRTNTDDNGGPARAEETAPGTP
jgi:hypothetical protein